MAEVKPVPVRKPGEGLADWYDLCYDCRFVWLA